jgi:hypothetical protein
MHSPLWGNLKMEIRAYMKLFIVLLVSLTPAQAGSPDKDALLGKYKNKFAVILQTASPPACIEVPAKKRPEP